jgi:leucyl aminopeptidase
MPAAGQVFDVIPSTRRPVAVSAVGADSALSSVDEFDAVAVGVPAQGEVPAALGLDRAALARSGFTGRSGQALAVPVAAGPTLVAVGLGAADRLDANELRRAGAAFARAVPEDGRLGFRLPAVPGTAVADAAAAVVEGVLLARYRFDMRSAPSGAVRVTDLVLAADEPAEAKTGAERGRVVAAAAELGRDLANCPAGQLTAARMAGPATVIAGYRVGDGPVNVVTPLMVYLAFVVLQVQRWKKSSGLGTVVAMMLPYTAVLIVTWTAFYVLWYVVGIPWGPNSPVHV